MKLTKLIDTLEEMKARAQRGTWPLEKDPDPEVIIPGNRIFLQLADNCKAVIEC